MNGMGVNFESLMFQNMMPPETNGNIAKLSPVYFPKVLLTLISPFVTVTAESGADNMTPSCPNQLLP
jgi:hypothetical protein